MHFSSKYSDVDLTSAFYGGSCPSPTSLKKVGRKEDRKVGYKLRRICVIPGFRRSENEIFVLLGCYATVIGRYRRFGAEERRNTLYIFSLMTITTSIFRRGQITWLQ